MAQVRNAVCAVGVACLLGEAALAQSADAPDLSDQTTVTMSATGEVTRTLAARFGETIDVRDFGATGNGSTDDTPAFAAAFSMAASALASRSVHVIVPPGRYMISSAWQPAISTANSLAVTGSGPDQSVIVFAGSDGFDVTATGGQTILFSGLKILTGNTASTYAATGISITTPSSDTDARALIDHLQFGDANGSRTHAWSTGIALTHVANSVLSDVRVLMPDWQSGATGVGVSLAGYASANWAIDNQIEHLFAQGGEDGLLVGGYAQGVYLNQAVLIGDGYGLYWNGTQSGDAAELLTVTNSAFNSHYSGIYVSDGSLSQIMSNQFFVFSPNTTDTSDLIDLEGGNNYTVGANVLTGAGTGTENGIVLDNLGQTANAVSGNTVSGVSGKGIWFEGTTRMAIASGNAINGPAITTAVQDDSNGYNVLGSVAYNGNPSPMTLDGVNANINTALLFPKSGASSAVISADGAGGLQVTNTGGNGNLLVQNGLTVGSGGITTGGVVNLSNSVNVGNLNSTNNIIVGASGSVLTSDSTGTAGYLTADGKGGVKLGTLRSGGSASFTAGANVVATGNVTAGANVYTGTGAAMITSDSTGNAGYLAPDNAGGLTVGTLRSGGSASLHTNANLTAGGTISSTGGITSGANVAASGNVTAGANIYTGTGAAMITSDSTGNAGYLAPDNAGGLTVGTLRSGGSASLHTNANLTAGGTISSSGGITSGGNLTAAANIYTGTGSAMITSDSTGNAGYLAPDNSGGLTLGTLRSGGVAGLSVGGVLRPGLYTVSTLPGGCTPGQIAYASDARKSGEAAGAGSGSPVICTLASKGGSAVWWSVFTDAQAVN